MNNPGRNTLCSCGSGEKFKQCHGKLEVRQFGSRPLLQVSQQSANAVAPDPAELGQLVALFNAGQYAELEGRARSLIRRYPG